MLHKYHYPKVNYSKIDLKTVQHVRTSTCYHYPKVNYSKIDLKTFQHVRTCTARPLTTISSQHSRLIISRRYILAKFSNSISSRTWANTGQTCEACVLVIAPLLTTFFTMS